jgi:thiol-disulfide isomerase/thioredoxin
MERHKEAQPFISILQDSTQSADQKIDARKSFDMVNNKVIAYQQNIIDQHPETMTARLFKATKQIKIPDPPLRSDGTIDSTFQLRWYSQHYFDYFDLGDEALLHLPKPIYSEKLNDYIDRLYVAHPDTLLKVINRLAGVAKKSQETYKYLVWNYLLKYQNPEIMGLDRVFVELYDTYFASGEMDFWATAKTKSNLKEHADRLRKSLVGNIGPNLIMQDITSTPRSMYDIKKDFTILFFFDPECGVCKKETPKLVDFYESTKFDVEVYAVSADTSMVEMRDYINDMKMKWITVNGPRTYVGSYHNLYDAQSTPPLYVLDKRKKIIAKKIPIEKLEEFLSNYSRFNP